MSSPSLLQFIFENSVIILRELHFWIGISS